MKRFIEGTDRSQTILLPECLDDYVSDDNPVRAIDSFVEMLDLASLGFTVEPEATGRPGYHPALMLRMITGRHADRVKCPSQLFGDLLTCELPAAVNATCQL